MGWIRGCKMRKKIILSIAFAVILAVAVFIILEWRKTDYQKIVDHFNKESVEEINKRIEDKDSFIIYIGSEECPYCVEFVKLLGNKYKEKKFEMTYLDEKKGDTLENIQAFREQYGIGFIPRVLVVKEGIVSAPDTPENQEEVNRFIDENS